MSAVVLNQQGYTNQLYADSLLTGAGGVVCQKGGAGVNANGPVSSARCEHVPEQPRVRHPN